jgi:hypothetical protein
MSALDDILNEIKKHDAISILNEGPVNAGKTQSKEELEELSIKLRNVGNDYFKRGNYLVAHNLYTRCIACVFEGPVSALAYANR